MSTASPMIKSAKGMKKKRKGISAVGYLSLGGGGGGGVYVLYSNLSLILGKIIS